MPWIRFEDNFPEHPKVLAISDSAFRLHVRAVGYCSRLLTDGMVSRAALGSLRPGRLGIRLAEELVAAKLWDRHSNGYVIHDYLVYQPSRAHVVEQRDAKSKAGRKGAQSRWGAGE